MECEMKMDILPSLLCQKVFKYLIQTPYIPLCDILKYQPYRQALFHLKFDGKRPCTYERVNEWLSRLDTFQRFRKKVMDLIYLHRLNIDTNAINQQDWMAYIKCNDSIILRIYDAFKDGCLEMSSEIGAVSPQPFFPKSFETPEEWMQNMLTIMGYFFKTGRTKLAYMMEVLIQDILDLMNWDPLVVQSLQRSFDSFFDSTTKSEDVTTSTRWLLYKENFDNCDERKLANMGDQLYARIALYGNCFGYILSEHEISKTDLRNIFGSTFIIKLPSTGSLSAHDNFLASLGKVLTFGSSNIKTFHEDQTCYLDSVKVDFSSKAFMESLLIYKTGQDK